MRYQPILGTLGYVVSPDRRSVLLLHRNTRSNDHHLGKYVGLGGKLERGESVTAGLRREIMEEAGITVTRMALRGTINWPGFGQNGEDWLGFIFLIEAFEGDPPSSNDEGTLSWQPIDSLLNGDLPIWEGDKLFLHLVLDSDPRVFHGVMPYHEGSPVSWEFERL